MKERSFRSSPEPNTNSRGERTRLCRVAFCLRTRAFLSSEADFAEVENFLQRSSHLVVYYSPAHTHREYKIRTVVAHG